MHSTDFYVSTCRYVMQADFEDPDSWVDLYRLVPCLRQSLSCYVCFNLVLDPMGPTDGVCKHAVCRKCVGGKMKLKPACSWCKDYWDFEPNPSLKILVKCFKKLCQYIYLSPIGQHIAAITVNGETNNILSILQEAINFDDSDTEVGATHQNTSHHTGHDTASHSNQTILHSVNNHNDDKSEESQPGCSKNEIQDKSDNVISTFQNDDKFDSNEQDGCPQNVNKTATEVSENKTEIHTNNIESLASDEISDLKDTNLNVRKSSRCRRLTGSSKSSIDEVINQQKKIKKKPSSNRENRIQPFKRRKTHNIKKKNIDNLIRKTLHRPQKKTLKHSVKKIKTKAFFQRPPIDLERADNTTSTKKIKHEMGPPELKPLTFCKCGKSGNFNRLTCLGQRCPCYSMKLPCIGCKCKGCRNPKKGPEGAKNGYYSHAVLRSEKRTLN